MIVWCVWFDVITWSGTACVKFAAWWFLELDWMLFVARDVGRWLLANFKLFQCFLFTIEIIINFHLKSFHNLTSFLSFLASFFSFWYKLCKLFLSFLFDLNHLCVETNKSFQDEVFSSTCERRRRERETESLWGARPDWKLFDEIL